jgi:hypothetical protein
MILELCTFKDLRVGNSFIIDYKETPIFIYTITSIIEYNKDKYRFCVNTQFEGNLELIRFAKTRVLKILK